MRPAAALLLAVMLPVAGCVIASGGDVPLRYPATENREAIAPGLDDGHAPHILLLPFIDRRPAPGIVGSLPDPATGGTAELAPRGSVSAWVTDAVAYELRRAGYLVDRAEALSDADTLPVVLGQVDVVGNTGVFHQGAEVTFTGELRSASRVVLRREYTGHGSAASGSRLTAELYGRSLSLALTAAVRSFAAEARDSLRASAR
jgi:hypothetical protein